MGQRLERWPSWIERALQGVAFWIGHRQSLYSDYPLSESAMVTEVCNLIHANLPHEYRLRCEVQYSELVTDWGDGGPLSERARVDLVVEERRRVGDADKERPLFVIEVKRAGAPRREIDKDLRRLAAVKSAVPYVRAFLFVISEGSRPIRFVSEFGQSILGKHKISVDAHYRVRRTWKAAKAYKTKGSAHYACLLEVFNTA